MNRPTWVTAAVFCFLVALGATERVVSYELKTDNFTPVAAATLFAGFYFSSLALAVAVPLASMAISDAWMYGNLEYFGHGRWEMLFVVYAALLMPLLFRPVLRSRLNVARVGIGAVISALLFFAVTNFAHWYFASEKTLTQVYIDGIPFIRGTILGDVVWSGLLFGGYALAMQLAPATVQPVRATVSDPGGQR